MDRNDQPPLDEGRFLRLWRLIAIATTTSLIAFTTVVDSLGRLYIRADFRVSEFVFGALISAWLILLGFEGASWLNRIRGNGRNGH